MLCLSQQTGFLLVHGTFAFCLKIASSLFKTNMPKGTPFQSDTVSAMTLELAPTNNS